MNNKDKSKILEVCAILIKECYKQDSDNVKIEIENEKYGIKCIFDFSIYVEE